jgi:DNA (cytosine-5)-methyltransferase 1
MWNLPVAITVRDAIGSLPELENGGGSLEMDYEPVQPSAYDRLMYGELTFEEFYNLL